MMEQHSSYRIWRWWPAQRQTQWLLLLRVLVMVIAWIPSCATTTSFSLSTKARQQRHYDDDAHQSTVQLVALGEVANSLPASAASQITTTSSTIASIMDVPTRKPSHTVTSNNSNTQTRSMANPKRPCSRCFCYTWRLDTQDDPVLKHFTTTSPCLFEEMIQSDMQVFKRASGFCCQQQFQCVKQLTRALCHYDRDLQYHHELVSYCETVILMAQGDQKDAFKLLLQVLPFDTYKEKR